MTALFLWCLILCIVTPHALHAEEASGQNTGILFEERTVTRGQAQRIASVPHARQPKAVAEQDGPSQASSSAMPTEDISTPNSEARSFSNNEARSYSPHPSAREKATENLLDSMDVYALSPHAAQLALPRMIPQSAVQQWYTSHTDAPQSKLGIASAHWSEIIRHASEVSGLHEALIAAVIGVESDFNPHAVSSAGAQGAMQIMPATQAELGLEDAFDPHQSVEAGSRYLRKQLDRFGSVELALAAYNAGPGNVERYGGVPPFKETQEYVRKVMTLYGQAIQ